MKRKVTQITLALALLSFAGFSQEGKIQPCNTYEAMEQAFAADPQLRKNYEEAQMKLSQDAEEYAKNNAGRSAAAFEYTVPVVFHILYDCGYENVSDAACISALAQVNKDFSRTSPDTGSIFAPFKALYINSEIKFVLAKKDPQGNCINGIVRHKNAKTIWDQGAAGNSAYWPYTWDPTKYLNIYVVTSIVPQGTVTGGGIIVGYTYKPGTWGTGNAHDAVVYIGSHLTGGSPVPNARSLTHELGHWLNLPHTFGNTNNPGVICADDGISDTPITKGNFGGCPASSTNSNVTCGTATIYYRNVENIMNYSDCSRNFTAGQTNVMRNALASAISGRNNLSTLPNLAFTDIYGTGSCAPKASFMSTNCSYTVCAGGSLTMKDFSYNSNSPLTLAWSADNGAVVASPSASITSIMFPNIGTSNVSLQTTNTQGNSSQVVQVTVLSATAAIIGPYTESFEAPGVPQDWTVIDEQNDAITWSQTGNASYHMVQSYMIDGSVNPPNNVDIMQMPTMDVLNNQNNVFWFAYAYRRMSATHDDQLKIQGSKDCGGTWSDIATLGASFMSSGSGGVSGDFFIPFNNEWKTYTISAHPNWQAFKTSPHVMVRFTFVEGTAGYGNNMYIDAVSFEQVLITGVNELTKSVRFNVYPNPTNGEANVSFHLDNASTIKVSVLDVTGREVLPATEKVFEAGDQTISVNKDNKLSKGVYFVNLSLNGATMSSKLVIH